MQTHAKIKILIADDHKMVRAGLAALLETENDMTVVGQAENGEEAVAKTLQLNPDVIVMDLMMPVKDGVEATVEIHQKSPQVKIVILTTYGTSDGIAHALVSGATGAITKSADNADLAKAIRRVFNGERSIAEEIQQQLETDPPIPDLTPRQKEILDSMIRGLSNKDIAKQLGISDRSVDEHVEALLSKIGASNRTEAVVIALRKHLLKV